MPEAQVGGAGQPLGRMTVQPHLGNPRADTLPQPVAQHGDARRLALHVPPADLHRLAEAHDPGDVLGASPPPPLVLAAVLHGDHLRALADEQSGHALGTVDLVTGERQEVDAEGVEVDRDLAEGLDGVHVKGDPALPRDLPDLARRLDGPDLGVGVHDGDQDGVGPHGAPDGVGIDQAGGVDGEVGHLEAERLEVLARPQHRVVLDPRGDDVPRVPGHGHALDGEVVRLGAARGEDDLLLADPQEVGDLLARGLQSLARLAAEAVDAGWVAEPLAEVREHRLEHFRVDRRRGVVIEVNPSVH